MEQRRKKWENKKNGRRNSGKGVKREEKEQGKRRKKSRVQQGKKVRRSRGQEVTRRGQKGQKGVTKGFGSIRPDTTLSLVIAALLTQSLEPSLILTFNAL